MKKLKIVLCIAGATALGTGCSHIDASTSNTIPTTNAYEASIKENNASAGSIAATGTGVTVDPEVDVATSGAFEFNNRSLTEAVFLNEAASTSMMQIKLAKLVQQRGADPEVKRFAEMMIDYHTKAALEMYSVASGMNYTLPAVMMPKHEKVVDRLAKLSGAELDEEYMEVMENVHEHDVALFEVASNEAPTVSVQAFAIRALPILRVHLNAAEKLEERTD